MTAATLSVSERRSIGQRGWRVYWTLTRAHANEPLRDLIGGALRTKCFEAAAAGLRLWEEMVPAAREQIVRQAEETLSPEALAKGKSPKELRHLIEVLSRNPPHREKRRNERRELLLAAYREELALQSAFPDRTKPAYDWAAVLLTAREEALLEEVKRRRQPDAR